MGWRDRTKMDGRIVASRTWGYPISNNRLRKSAHKQIAKLTRRLRKAQGRAEIQEQLNEETQ